MKTRIVTAAVLAAGVLLGTSGCTLYASQATRIAYDPSDGVSGTVGELELRNGILLSQDGDTANLLLTVINLGDEPKQLTVQYETGAGEKVTEQVTVTGNTTVTLGSTDEPEITLEGLDALPGSLFPVFVQYGDETGAELLMPILDGSLDSYSDLTPALLPDLPAATPTPTEMPTETSTETPAA